MRLQLPQFGGNRGVAGKERPTCLVDRPWRDVCGHLGGQGASDRGEARVGIQQQFPQTRQRGAALQRMLNPSRVGCHRWLFR